LRADSPRRRAPAQPRPPQAIPREVLGLTFGVPADRFEGLDLDVAYIAPQ
jgi:hypothetical protein